MARRLLEPSRLAPVPVNLTHVFLVGTGIWLAALAVAAMLAVSGSVEWRTVVTCAAGAAMGVAGALWARRRGPQD